MKRRNRGAQSVDSQSEAQETVVASARDHQGITTTNQESEKSMKLTINGTEYEYEVRFINGRAVAIGCWVYLSGANLSRAKLTSANLSFADLSRANLHGANLSDANLRFANLSDANLTYANLIGADLSGANLIGSLNLGTAFGLHTVKGKPTLLPEGWKYTEGRGIHKTAPKATEPTCAHVQHGKFCSDCGVAL